MLFTKKEFRKIVIPLIIEQLLAVSIGMFDSMMVSSAGEAALSGVSLVDTVNLLLVYMFSALASGGAVIISQFLGREEYERARNACKQLIWVVFLTAFTICSLSILFRFPILRLIFGKVADDVMENAAIYFLFTALSYPFLGIYNAGAAIFRSMGNSRISMIASLIMNLINVTGNAILIFGFHLGAAGAAIATLFARMIGACIMLVLLRNKRNLLYVEALLKYKPDFGMIGNICRIGIPSGLENSMFQLGKVLTQSLIATFATSAIAANAVGNSVTALQYIPGSAISLAMITIVGRCIGAGEQKQAKQYTVKLMRWAYMCIVCVSLFLCIFINQVLGLYDLSSESVDLAKKLIFLHSAFVCTIWPLAFTLPNCFRAASDVRFTMVLSIISMWTFRVGLSYVFTYIFEFGIFSVWFAMFSDWIFRGISFIIRYLSGAWLKKYKPS